MKTFGALCLVVMCGCGAFAQAPAELSPGVMLRLNFPDLPSPMEAQKTGATTAPEAHVRLPDNYESKRAFPVMLFLDGGSGGTGEGALHRAVGICGGRDFVCVGLPLFASLPSKEAAKGGTQPVLGIRDADAELIWTVYATMLKKIYGTIPNLDHESSFIGGFSNGAHTIGVLLNRPHSAAEIGAYFRNVFLVEGGYRWTHLEEMKRGHLLILKGAARSPQPMDDFVKRAEAAGLRVTSVAMPGVAHAFPAEHEATVRRWVEDVRD